MNDEKYHALINQIKLAKPKLENPQVLTQEILCTVTMIDNKSSSQWLLKFIAWGSSVAAVVLLGLLFWELTFATVSTSRNYQSPTSLSKINMEQACFSGRINTLIQERREHIRERDFRTQRLSISIKTFKNENF